MNLRFELELNWSDCYFVLQNNKLTEKVTLMEKEIVALKQLLEKSQQDSQDGVNDQVSVVNQLMCVFSVNRA